MSKRLVCVLLLMVGLGAPTLGATKEALPALIKTLTQGTDTVARMEAAKKLGLSRHSQAVAPLVKTLDDANRAVRWAAIEALGELRRKEAAPDLLKYLERQEAYRWGNILTVNALAAIHDHRAVKPLVALLKGSTDPILQRVVILALGKLGDAKTIPTVMPFLKDDRRWLRRAAQVSLVELTRDRLQGKVPRGYDAWMKWYKNQRNRRAVQRRN